MPSQSKIKARVVADGFQSAGIGRLSNIGNGTTVQDKHLKPVYRKEWQPWRAKEARVLSFVFEVLLAVLTQAIGHSVVYVCTLGQKRCGDDFATIIGIGFLLALIFLIAFVI